MCIRDSHVPSVIMLVRQASQDEYPSTNWKSSVPSGCKINNKTAVTKKRAAVLFFFFNLTLAFSCGAYWGQNYNTDCKVAFMTQQHAIVTHAGYNESKYSFACFVFQSCSKSINTWRTEVVFWRYCDKIKTLYFFATLCGPHLWQKNLPTSWGVSIYFAR